VRAALACKDALLRTGKPCPERPNLLSLAPAKHDQSVGNSSLT